MVVYPMASERPQIFVLLSSWVFMVVMFSWFSF